MKLMSNDEVYEMKMHNDKVERLKSLREKKRTEMKIKLIDTPFGKYA